MPNSMMSMDTFTVARYKNEPFKTFKFKIPFEDYLPTYVAQNLDEFLRQRHSVMCIRKDINGYITCTICGTDAVETLLSHDFVVVANKACPYELCENKWKRIRIYHPPTHLKTSEIDNILRQYGRVVVSEFETRHRSRFYFAVIELRRDLPGTISLKRRMCDIIVDDCS